MATNETEASKAIPKPFPMSDWFYNYIGTSKMQIIFTILLLIIFPFLAAYLRVFDGIHQMRIQNNPDYNWPKYSDLLVSFLSAATLIIVNSLLKFLLLPICRQSISLKYTGTNREDRAKKQVDSLLKASYFFLAFVAGYWVAKDSDWLPPSLGGSGSFSNCWRDFPYQNQEAFPYIRIYIQVQLGYHLHSLILHLYNKPRNDFMEMLLHHFMTVFLVGCSYLMNYMNITLLILFCHDLSDVFVHSTRVIVDTEYSKLAFCSYVMLMISWVYMRLWVLPTELVYYTCYVNDYYYEIYGIEILGFMTHVLILLHIYWFVLLSRMGFRFLKFGEAKDSINDMKTSERQFRQDGNKFQESLIEN